MTSSRHNPASTKAFPHHFEGDIPLKIKISLLQSGIQLEQ